MSKAKITEIELEQLYLRGNSMKDIAKILDCSVHKVAYWMNKYDIRRRTISEALYKKLNPNGDPFIIKTDLSNGEMFLNGLGLGIYWGEGNKISKNAVRVTNSDPAVIVAFRKFLIEICGVIEDKIRYSLVCFNDANVTLSAKYWSEVLNISDRDFGKIVQIPAQGKGTYKRKSQFGVCTITVSNIKLKAWIMQQLSVLK